MINVILPTYNESECIAPLIRMLDNVFTRLSVPYLLVIVDDNSPDGTAAIVRSLNNENAIVVDRPGKLGLGSAYVEGLKHCIHPYTVIMDSDLQHNPFDILEMYKLASKGCDIVTGTRYHGEGKVSNCPFFRRLMSCTANNIARFLLDLRIHDLTGSFRMYRTDILTLLVQEVTCKRFGFQMEILALAEKRGMKIVECPIIFYQRHTGVSKISSKEIIFFLMAVLRLYLGF